ncbi:MAG: Jag N-terminal domain-containing protein [Aerococcus suis]|nr:Jag N-terminal domain-containing protein [Aerococcus suis]
MKKEKFQAETLEEAVRQALEKYQVERSMVQIDIIQRDRKGLLGIGAKDAIIEVTFPETPEAEDVHTTRETTGVEKPATQSTATIEETDMSNEGKTVDTDKDVTVLDDEETSAAIQTDDESVAVVDNPSVVTSDDEEPSGVVNPEEGDLSDPNDDKDSLDVSGAVAGDLTAENDVDTVSDDANHEETQEPVMAESEPSNDMTIDEGNEEESASEVENIEKVARYLMDVCDAYLAPITVDVEDYGDEIIYHLNTDKPGLVIGKHGKIINSLETLAKVLTHRHVRNRVHVMVNVGDYRERREKTLEHLARKTADRVTETQEPVYLDPLPASERKIIHSQLARYQHISTHSEGREPHRYLVVKYVN